MSQRSEYFSKRAASTPYRRPAGSKPPGVGSGGNVKHWEGQADLQGFNSFLARNKKQIKDDYLGSGDDGVDFRLWRNNAKRRYVVGQHRQYLDAKGLDDTNRSANLIQM